MQRIDNSHYLHGYHVQVGREDLICLSHVADKDRTVREANQRSRKGVLHERVDEPDGQVHA